MSITSNSKNNNSIGFSDMGKIFDAKNGVVDPYASSNMGSENKFSELGVADDSMKEYLQNKIVSSQESGVRQFKHLSGFAGSTYDPDKVAKERANIQSPTSNNTYTPANYANIPKTLKELGVKTTDYGGSTRYEKFHPAIDIANVKGTPIPAFVDGTITEVVLGKKQGEKGYGNYVIVTDANGNKHRYSHLDAANVKVGDMVKKGQAIGDMGNSGSTYSTKGGDGTHLDYRIVDKYNQYVNPYEFLSNY